MAILWCSQVFYVIQWEKATGCTDQDQYSAEVQATNSSSNFVLICATFSAAGSYVGLLTSAASLCNCLRCCGVATSSGVFSLCKESLAEELTQSKKPVMPLNPSGGKWQFACLKSIFALFFKWMLAPCSTSSLASSSLSSSSAPCLQWHTTAC